MTMQPTAKHPQQRSAEWIRSPWMTLMSAALGVYIGTSHQTLAQLIAPVGELYLNLLKLCVLPILLSAITTSVGRLMTNSHARPYIRRILVVFPVSLVLLSTLTVAIALMTGPGRNLTDATLATLGILVHNSGIDLEMALTGPLPVETATGLSILLTNMVPDNVFSALSDGQTLKVLVFSIIFGVSLGLLQESRSTPIFEMLETLFQAFNQLIHWLTWVLPLGLCSLLAYQLSRQGTEVISAMMNFILVAIATYLLTYLLNTVVIWQRSGLSLLQVLNAVREPVILALATSSSLACLPSAIAQLAEPLHFNRQAVNLVTPLAITICRFGSVIYFALGSLFVTQLYHHDLTLTEFGVVIIGSIIAGMATAGITGILTLTMLGLVLEPLKLPLEAVLVLFIAIDPMMDPLRTLSIVYTGMATTALIAEPDGRSRQASKPPVIASVGRSQS